MEYWRDLQEGETRQVGDRVVEPYYCEWYTYKIGDNDIGNIISAKDVGWVQRPVKLDGT